MATYMASPASSVMFTGEEFKRLDGQHFSSGRSVSTTDTLPRSGGSRRGPGSGSSRSGSSSPSTPEGAPQLPRPEQVLAHFLAQGRPAQVATTAMAAPTAEELRRLQDLSAELASLQDRRDELQILSVQMVQDAMRDRKELQRLEATQRKLLQVCSELHAGRRPTLAPELRELLGASGPAPEEVPLPRFHSGRLAAQPRGAAVLQGIDLSAPVLHL